MAHPGLVEASMKEFVEVLGDRPNQWEKQTTGPRRPQICLNFQPETPITEAGLRNNINVGIHYLAPGLRATAACRSTT